MAIEGQQKVVTVKRVYIYVVPQTKISRVKAVA